MKILSHDYLSERIVIELLLPSLTRLTFFLEMPMPDLSAPRKERVSAADRKSSRLEQTTPQHNP